ncbi:MAG: hypothetical protein IPJ81_17785 [Chitinophagaceae bacterium]|nr:hypothetical protein [Chitinophagaceae bacterium]
MNFIPGKYLQLPILKVCFNIVLVLFLCTKAPAQITYVIKDSYDIKNNLSNSITSVKTQHSFQRIDYTPPNNQLMSWPDYPLTTSQIEQRNEKWKQDHKLSNIIAKDIVESILSKKKKVAVVPKF